jgi:hypothetical protein
MIIACTMISRTWKKGSKGSVGESVRLELTEGVELREDLLERFKFSSSKVP